MVRRSASKRKAATQSKKSVRDKKIVDDDTESSESETIDSRSKRRRSSSSKAEYDEENEEKRSMANSKSSPSRYVNPDPAAITRNNLSITEEVIKDPRDLKLSRIEENILHLKESDRSFAEKTDLVLDRIAAIRKEFNDKLQKISSMETDSLTNLQEENEELRQSIHSLEMRVKKLSTELLEKEKALQESQIIEQVNEVYTTLTNVHVKDIIKEEDTDTVSVQLEALNSNGESAVKFLLKFNDGEVEYSPLELSVPHEDFFSDPEGIAFSALGCPLFFKKLLEVVHGPDEEESE